MPRTPRGAIRRAHARDHDALRDLEDAAFQPWRRASRRSLRRSLASPRQSVWLIPHPTRRGRLAGLLIVWHHRTRLRVYDVATAPDLRGQGYGHRLLEHAEALARRDGCADVSLEADARDKPLLAWYGRHGYRRVARLPGFYVGGRDAVRLRKEM